MSSSPVTFKNKIGLGTMGLTWTPDPTPKDQAFEAIKTAIDHGVDLIVSGEFYGIAPPEANLILLKEFFEEFPELRSKVKVSVKGAFDLSSFSPDGSKKGIAKSINNILNYLEYIDIFECARVDPSVPIEDSIGYIKEFVEAGKVRGISLSEASATTIRRAAAVHPISAVELEFSLWARHILQDGVYETCQELNIPILAYSPLGRGFLTGRNMDFDEIKTKKNLAHFQRFTDEEIFNHNKQLVEKLSEFAAKKNVTPSQLALAWILRFKGIVPIPGSSKASRVSENLKSQDISLTDTEFEEINNFLDNFEVKGYRYNEMAEKSLMQ